MLERRRTKTQGQEEMPAQRQKKQLGKCVGEVNKPPGTTQINKMG